MSTLADEALLTDVMPISDPKNISSKILRRGVAISAFSALELYLETAFENFLSRLSASGHEYKTFSIDLKRFVTSDALTGILTRFGFTEASQKQSFVDSHIPLLSGYTNVPPTFSSIGFSPKGSNVGHEDVKVGLKACGVSDPWAKLSKIAASLGSGRISLIDDYKNLSSSRNDSAHNPAFNIPTATLKTHIECSTVIAICCDIILEECALAFESSKKYSDACVAIASIVAKPNYVDSTSGGQFSERSASGTSTLKIYSGEAQAIAGALARKSVRYVVVRDRSNIPTAVHFK